MEFIKKIYTILTLIKNLIFRKKHYKLHFVAENNTPIKRWYYDFKYFGFEHEHLEMVAGADTLCEYYAKGKNELTVEIIATKKPLININKQNYDTFIGETIPKNTKLIDKILYGRNYTHYDHNDGHKVRMWICPVTLFVLGRYPKYLYIRRGLMIDE